jgi:hypothetical protein
LTKNGQMRINKEISYTDTNGKKINLCPERLQDPDVFVAQPMHEWMESDAGKFVMEHAVDKLYWHRTNDIASYGHRYDIVARLSEQNETFWTLKWGNK